MPPIQTIQTRDSLLGRTAGMPEASASSFGGSMGEATQRLGGVLAQGADVAARISAVHKSLESDKWTNDAMSELRQFYGPWMADNENNSKETFADDFKALADKSLKDWEAKAPNNETRVKFREQFQRYRDSRLEAASVTASKTKLDNMLLSHEALNGSIVSGYEVDRTTPNIDANKELMSNMADRFASIDQSLGTIAPNKAKELKGQLIEDSAYATMNYSPSTARKILAQGTGILDGRRIHAIENQIKTAEESIKAVDMSTLNTMVENRVDAAKLGRQPAKFDLKDIQLYLPDDKAIILRDKVNAQIDTYNLANQHVTDISSWSGPEQVKFVEDLRANAGKDEKTASRDYDVLRFVEQRVNDNVRWFNRDPAGYMIANNPAIKGIDDHIKSLLQSGANADSVTQKRAERDELLLRFQSTPGPDATPTMRRQYNVVNRAQLKVMSDAEAKASVEAINQSSPQEALNTIIGELKKHPGKEAIAFNNLVQLQEGQGIKGDYWLVYKNWKNPAVADLVGALQHAKEAKELTADKMSDFDKALDGYVPWKQFAQTFPSDNNQMEGMLGGMRSGIMSYALVQAQTQKISPELAIKKSVDTWLYSEMAMTSVNGQPVLLERDRHGQPKLSDSEAANLGRRLGELPKVLDPREISTVDSFGRDHFPILRSIGNENTRIEQLRQIMLDRGFFKPSADGKSATFYLRNDTGTPFEVRDSKNRAIQVDINDVPTFVQHFPTRQIAFDKVQLAHDEFVPITVNPIFTTETKEVPFAPDRPEFRAYRGYTKVETTTVTNWPVEPSYIKRVQR